MIIDGEKWACESCVRGHRVSNCSHTDRQLQHINKKGRPVSQCEHCRSLRRSKSAHHKCDCGEKVTKCPHLQASVEGHRDTCCCNHGAPCTCAHNIKKEPQLDTVPESDSDHEASSSTSSKVSKAARKRRSRASTQNADGLCFDEHGHHKPTYKHVKPHEKVGPYPLTRGHSNQSASSLEDLGDEEFFFSSGNISFSQINDQRLAKSETASPLMTAASSVAQSVASLPILDTAVTQEWLLNSDLHMFGDPEAPIMSAGITCPEIDWANYGPVLGFQESTEMAPSNYSQGTGSFFDQPSTLPSGEVSEVDDLSLPANERLDRVGSFSRTNTASTGFSFDHSQENLPVLVGMDNADIDFTKLNKGLEAYEIDPIASLAVEDPSTNPSDSFTDMFWPPHPREGELDLNENLCWPPTS